MYMDRGLLQKAKANYIDACRLDASATSWLGLGKVCLKMGEFREAEEALAEANIHNNHNSEVCGRLAIVIYSYGLYSYGSYRSGAAWRSLYIVSFYSYGPYRSGAAW